MTTEKPYSVTSLSWSWYTPQSCLYWTVQTPMAFSSRSCCPGRVQTCSLLSLGSVFALVRAPVCACVCVYWRWRCMMAGYGECIRYDRRRIRIMETEVILYLPSSPSAQYGAWGHPWRPHLSSITSTNAQYGPQGVGLCTGSIQSEAGHWRTIYVRTSPNKANYIWLITRHAVVVSDTFSFLLFPGVTWDTCYQTLEVFHTYREITVPGIWTLGLVSGI